MHELKKKRKEKGPFAIRGANLLRQKKSRQIDMVEEQLMGLIGRSLHFAFGCKENWANPIIFCCAWVPYLWSRGDFSQYQRVSKTQQYHWLKSAQISLDSRKIKQLDGLTSEEQAEILGFSHSLPLLLGLPAHCYLRLSGICFHHTPEPGHQSPSRPTLCRLSLPHVPVRDISTFTSPENVTPLNLCPSYFQTQK